MIKIEEYNHERDFLKYIGNESLEELFGQLLNNKLIREIVNQVVFEIRKVLQIYLNQRTIILS